MRRLLRFTLVITLILFLIGQSVPIDAAPPRQESFNADKALRASVYIMQVYTNALGQTVVSCVGSGTLVSAQGLILTNAHIALPGSTCKSDKLAIGLSVRPGEAPVATYYAQTVASNLGWDLAVLQIVSTLDGRPVDRNALSLPFVEIGDSEAVRLDESINVVGYALSEEKSTSIAQTARGTIGGFTAESRIGDRAWIKTAAAIPGGMSGGGAYSTDGKLIGIPTIEPSRSSGGALNCRRIQDSNTDGRIDEKDTCIPVSGFINALRPSRLARGLILAAELGISPVIKPAAKPLPEPGNTPTFNRLIFAPGVNQAGMPTTVVNALAAGTTRLYLFFDYNDMRDGMIYELRVTVDGVPNPTFSLAPATWSGGKQGLWYIGSTAQTWPNGSYDFSLFIEGNRVASKQITIGGPVRVDPAFTDILFGVDDSSGQLVNRGDVLPVGNTINAEFIYNNIKPEMPWHETWYYEGLKINEVAGTWKDGTNGKKSINATASGAPLTPGRYRLELYLGDNLVATSDFIMAGALTGLKTEIFKNVAFATDLKDNAPSGIVGTTFGNTISKLYATFDWRELGPGIPWTWRWSVDDNRLFEVTQPWTDESDGATNWMRLDGTGRLPDGSYKLELIVAGVVMGTATAKVGLGQLPVTTFGVAQGVQVQGRIIDAETGQGIPGVAFIVIKVDFDTKDFAWDMSQVYTLSFSDSQGQFTLSKLLPPETDKTYSIIIIARGYLPINTDGLKIDGKTKSPMILNIALNRD